MRIGKLNKPTHKIYPKQDKNNTFPYLGDTANYDENVGRRFIIKHPEWTVLAYLSIKSLQVLGLQMCNKFHTLLLVLF